MPFPSQRCVCSLAKANWLKMIVLMGCLAGPMREIPSLGQTPSPFNAQVGPRDWPQLGGSPHRNNTPNAEYIPTEWDIKTGKNIKWSAVLGSEAWGNIVVANGKIFVGTNNGASYLKRYPAKIDLGVQLCFRESDGEFLWQYSSEKLAAGRVHDWPDQGICSAPVVEGDRLWFVTNRGEVVCLDSEGFKDKENDGPFTSEKPENLKGEWEEESEADVVWKFDMMKELGVRQHNMATCAPTIWGDLLFICTSNGVDETHVKIPAPEAPSFIAMDKRTGAVLWTDNSPGKNIMHGQWSCPAVGILGGVPQVIFPGGDGWLYSFRADRGKDGKPELLWKFDGNAKDAVYRLTRSTRNGIIAVPVIHDGLVYFAMGDDPEHGEGPGCLWCVDPTKRGDVSTELVVDQDGNSAPHQRFQATAAIGDRQLSAIPNPNSALVWKYTDFDRDANGKADFEKTMHRTVGSPTIKDGLLFITDFSGIVHCLDVKSGKPHWTCDLLAACWTTPLIVGDRVYVGDEDGEVSIFALSADESLSSKEADPKTGAVDVPKHEIPMDSAIYATPVVANNVLYIASRSTLFAIETDANDAPAKTLLRHLKRKTK
jgi:outer membrane protein assembly factor BamB